jgi:hypothetical protein
MGQELVEKFTWSECQVILKTTVQFARLLANEQGDEACMFGRFRRDIWIQQPSQLAS